MNRTVTREQIAEYVGNAFAVTWANRSELLRTAHDNNAPYEVIQELVELPEHFYRDLDEVWDRLPRLAVNA